MQKRIDESNDLLVKERENAQKAVTEAVSVANETPVTVEDTEKIETLTAEIDNLKVDCSNLVYYFFCLYVHRKPALVGEE